MPGTSDGRAAAAIVRRYASGDLQALLHCFNESVRTIAARDYTSEQIAIWAPEVPDAGAWARRLETGATFVAEAGGALAGFARVQESGYIDLLYVTPDHERQGIGRALLDEACAFAIACGARALESDVSISARRLFEVAGFSVAVEQSVERMGVVLTNFRMRRPPFSSRVATPRDLPELRLLMDAAIRTLIGAHLDAAHVAASFEIMGIDSSLIDDGTYFAVMDGERIAACGGWSRRATLFGGDHSAGRDARLLDASTEPARVRAMYTHPAYARRGIGRMVLGLSEAAARHEGFRSLELVATVAGEPLYAACGFTVIERIEVPTSSGLTVPCARMTKAVA